MGNFWLFFAFKKYGKWQNEEGQNHKYFIYIYIYIHLHIYMDWLNLLKGLFMARFINTPGVGVWELGRRFNSHLSWWVGDFWYLDLEELQVTVHYNIICACPCSTTEVSLELFEVFEIQFGESFDLYNLIVKGVFSFKKLIHARKIFSDCHFRHPSVSEGRLQGAWTRHSLGNNLHTLPKFNVALVNRPSQKETGLPTNISQGLC